MNVSNPQVASERNQNFTKAKGNSSDGKFSQLADHWKQLKSCTRPGTNAGY